MKGIRFYEELTSKGHKAEKSKGTVVAVLWENYQVELDGYNDYYAQFDAIASITETENAGVGSTCVGDWWLRSDCRRVSEKQAREIHPALFVYLEG